MNDKQRSALLHIAAQMFMGDGLPPEFVADWGLPKTTPVTARRQIQRRTEETRRCANRWAKEIMRILDEQPKTSGLSACGE